MSATTIEEPEFRPYEKSATDIARIAIGVLVILGGLLLGYVLRGVDTGLTIAITQSFLALPDWLTLTIVNAVAVIASLTTVVVIVVVLFRRAPRFLLVAAIAQVVAVIVLALLHPSSVPLDAATTAALKQFETVLTHGGNTSARAVSLIAVLAAMAAPWLGRTWARWLWILLAIYSYVWLVGTPDSPGVILVAVGAGVAGAGVPDNCWGDPTDGPAARRSLPTSLGPGWNLRACGPHRWTRVVPRPTSGRRPTAARSSSRSSPRTSGVPICCSGPTGTCGSSTWVTSAPSRRLRRAVEHEALVALWASANGIRTPAVASVATIGEGGIGLAYERIDGRSLDGVDADELDAATLQGAWGLVAQLREHGIAHRDLRLANMFLADDGMPWLIDFGFSEWRPRTISCAATSPSSSPRPRQGRRRVARSRHASRCSGTEVLADAAPRLQPMALSTATRDAIKQRSASGQEPAAGGRARHRRRPDRLRAPRTRPLLHRADHLSLALALYLLAPQFAGFKSLWSHVGDIRWNQVVPALVASGLTYVGARSPSWARCPEALPFGRTFLAQLAGSFVNRIVPGRVGGMATNVLYLQKRGVDTPVAVAGVGIQQVMGGVVHVAMRRSSPPSSAVRGAGRRPPQDVRFIIVIVRWCSPSPGCCCWSPGSGAQIRPRSDRRFVARLDGLRAIAHQPRKLLELFGGATLLNIAFIGALVLSVRAFGGTPPSPRSPSPTSSARPSLPRRRPRAASARSRPRSRRR